MENFFIRLPLRTLRGKFLSINIPIMIMALIGVIIVFAVMDYRDAIDDYNASLDRIIEVNNRNLALALKTKDKKLQHAIVHKILKDPIVTVITLYDKHDNILLHAEEKNSDKSYYITVRNNQIFDQHTYIGSLKIIASAKNSMLAIKSRLLLDIYLSLLAVLVTTLTALIVNRYIIDIPLERLLQAIELTKKTSVNHTVLWDSRDEVGAVIRAFNDMQLQVQQKTDDLTLAKESAVAASKAKSDFLSNISHELRTPMHAIMGLTNIAISKFTKWSPAQTQQTLSEIKSSSERLLILLNELLDLSKLEAGKMSFDFKQHNLINVTELVIKELEPLIAFKKINLQMHASPFEDLYAEFDYTRIGQVIRNLISNSIKFCQQGGTIGITLSADQNLVQVAVFDNGIGLPHNELESVFEKFTQSSKTKTGAGGTGLGLSICKNIIAAHHGTIVASNNDGPGATFTFCIPKRRN